MDEKIVETAGKRKLLKTFGTSAQGLSTSEATRRLKHSGPNTFKDSEKQSIVKRLLSKFKNPLVILLIVAAGFSAFTGALVDCSIIIGIVILSVVLDTYQEHQSEEAAEHLKQKVAIKVTVIRDHEHKEIHAAHVIPGDIVVIETGNVVPADMKLLFVKDLHIDESTLTGESFPVEKQELETVLMGTTVMNGEGIGVVIKTGKETQFGTIAQKLNLTRPETDFEKGIRQFGYLVMQITLALVISIFLINVFFHRDLFESLFFAIALAVGLTPELLPMIVTVNLSKGAMRMAKHGVIVKHLPAIQNFGSMTVLCTDKTGTITENRIQLERYENVHADNDEHVLEFAYINSSFQSNLKSPLDEAVLKHKEAMSHGYEKIDEIPFDFIRRRLSVVVKKHDEVLIVCKGAPESIFDVCSEYEDHGKVKKMGEKEKKILTDRFEVLSADGFRVLGIAYRRVTGEKEHFQKTDEHQLVFLGFTAFLDPPKHDVKEVLDILHTDGVKLKILTGDNELVTQKVCQELHIPIEGVLVGKQIAHLSDEELSAKVEHTNIFARLTPDQKERIILALKNSGAVVGYMGDGVNDAVSLRAADIGISVENAVDVAKEAADMILVHKSLHVLKDGIYEGRKTFENTMKYIFMAMGSNFGNMVSVSFASLFLPFLPMLPIQILLNNLMYDFSQITLPTDNVDETAIRQPQHWDIRFIRKFMYVFGPISSIFDLTTFYFMIHVFHASVPMFRTGWFMESLASQSLIVLAVRTKMVPFFKSKPAPVLVITSIGAMIAGIIVTQSPLQNLFQFVTLPVAYWVFLCFLLIDYLILVELAKSWFYRHMFRVSAV